jgi:hypothetical protein
MLGRQGRREWSDGACMQTSVYAVSRMCAYPGRSRGHERGGLNIPVAATVMTSTASRHIASHQFSSEAYLHRGAPPLLLLLLGVAVISIPICSCTSRVDDIRARVASWSG